MKDVDKSKYPWLDLDLISIEEVADRFAVKPCTVRLWCQKNSIQFFRTPGGQLRFRRKDIEVIPGRNPSRDESDPDGSGPSRYVDKRRSSPLDPSLITIEEVADRFGVNARTIRLWCGGGRFPFFRTPGGQLRFRREEIDKFISDREGDR